MRSPLFLLPLDNGRRAFGLTTLVLALAGLVPAGASFATELASVVVQPRAVAVGLPFEATVEAVRQATVMAQVPGRILELRSDVGRPVRQGETLARVDVREASGNDAASRAQLAQARAALERTRELHSKKFVSQAALDQAEASFKSAQGSVTATAAAVSHGSVAAPLSGVVARRHVEVGEMAGPGVALFTVFDPKALRVLAAIPQYKLADVKRAGKAWVEFPELGLSVAATRIEILPAIDAASHTATARVYLPEGMPGVMPGMAARARFALDEAAKQVLPPSAVVRRGEVTAVYVLPENGTPRLRQVRLGEAVANGDLEILAGLSNGERVALDAVKAGLQARQATR